VANRVVLEATANVYKLAGSLLANLTILFEAESRVSAVEVDAESA
jgi:hypothetical protein